MGDKFRGGFAARGSGAVRVIELLTADSIIAVGYEPLKKKLCDTIVGAGSWMLFAQTQFRLFGGTSREGIRAETEIELRLTVKWGDQQSYVRKAYASTYGDGYWGITVIGAVHVDSTASIELSWASQILVNDPTILPSDPTICAIKTSRLAKG